MAAEDERKEVMGFKLGQLLGRREFSFVKEATLNGQNYAMKVITKGSSGWNATEEEMVKKEIAIMEKLDHPHIIRVISSEMNAKYPRDGGAEDCAIIVMELAQGGNLFDVLFFTDGFTEEITRTYLAQLVDAISAMHNLGIAHCDIKPQNILLDSNFNLKICNFGLSKERDGASCMTTRLGCRPFQAPEILMSRPYGFEVDVFALGVIYFLMLSGGVPPFITAATTDKWFKYIAGKHEGKFWKKHKKACKKITTTCGGEEEMKLAVQLFFWMCAYQPTERPTIQQVATHDWFNKPKMEGEELKTVMKQIVNEAIAKKRENPDLGCEVSETVHKLSMEVLDFDQKVGVEAVSPDWFDDLDQRDKDNAVQLLSQSLQHYNGLNQDVIMDMETKFGIIPAQTQQLYEFLYPRKNKMEGEELKTVMKQIVNEAMAKNT